MKRVAIFRRRLFRRLGVLASVLGLTVAGSAVMSAPARAASCGVWTGLGAAGNVYYSGMYVGQVALEWNNCSGAGYGVRAHFQWANGFVQWYVTHSSDSFKAFPELDGFASNGQFDYLGQTNESNPWPSVTDVYAPSASGAKGMTVNPGNTFQAKVTVHRTKINVADYLCYAFTDTWNFGNGHNTGGAAACTVP